MTDIRPDFAKGNGLLPAIAQDHATGEVLMLAYMDEEAWETTLATGEAHYHSRSRNELWRKGGTSGHVQRVLSVRIDCDADTILIQVEQIGGAACHKGYRSCFFRQLSPEDGLWSECSPLVFDPKEVYK
ncbi:MAG: phosphoribosyl-AMP cyclohydrolase [Deltaproteobacteria bacterium]|nr:phosphoribosyl-AMP cyclohydrolase [Deltaproteobacteria bacterium]